MNILPALQAASILKALKDLVPAAKEARQWYESIRSRPKNAGSATSTKSSANELANRLEELGERVDQLEADEIKHADLTAEVAAQVEIVAQGLQLVARRTTALLFTSSIALVIAVAALIAVVLR